MKRRYAILLLALLAAPVIVIAYDVVSIYPSNAQAAAGAVNISVPINLNNNDSIAVLEFQINHTNYIVPVSVTNTSRIFNGTIEWNTLTPQTTKVAAFVPGNISPGSGPIMNVIFDVNSSAVPGNYSILLSGIIITNVEINELPVSPSGGIFTIL